MKNITVQPHLTVSNLKERYLKAKSAMEARRWHILWLLSTGQTVKDVSPIVGLTEAWIRKVVQQYNRKGEEVVGDQRKHNKGNTPILSDQQKQELVEALKVPPPDGGLWNGVKVASWMKTKTGRKMIYPQRGWQYLVNLGFSLKVPRPTHKKRNKKTNDNFKKNSQKL